MSVADQWLPFFPGPIADGVSTIPHIFYGMDRALPLRPKGVFLRHIEYEDVQEEQDECLLALHPHWDGTKGGYMHQGAGLYRLTLCERGCVPTVENTVLMGLGHLKVYMNYYGR